VTREEIQKYIDELLELDRRTGELHDQLQRKMQRMTKLQQRLHRLTRESVVALARRRRELEVQEEKTINHH